MIYLASDHAGLSIKEEIKKLLDEVGEEYFDFGTASETPVDYPDLIIPCVERAIAEDERAIVFGGTGLGECIAANKVKGALAVCPWDEFTAVKSREHNNSNVLCLGSRTLKIEEAKNIVELWLDTPNSQDERHARRIDKIKEYENREGFR